MGEFDLYNNFKIVGDWIVDAKSEWKVAPVVPELKIHVGSNGTMPRYESEGDSGMDVCSDRDYLVLPRNRVMINTDLRIEIPKHPLHEFGKRWELEARARSGISNNTYLRVSNGIGTVDNFYRDEIKILLWNAYSPLNDDALEFTDHVLDLKGKRVSEDELKELNLNNIFTGNRNRPYYLNTYLIRKGDRVAQLVLGEVTRPLQITVGKISTEFDRGGGLGHSGV